MVTQVVVGALEISTAHVTLLTWTWEETNERYQVCVCGHSVVSDSVTLWIVTCQVPLSMEFSRQKQSSLNNTLCVQGVDCDILEN